MSATTTSGTSPANWRLQLMRDAEQEKRREDEGTASVYSALLARTHRNRSKRLPGRNCSRKSTLDDIRPSNRKYPFINFKPEREAGKQLLTVDGFSKSIDGEKLLNDVNFVVNKGDKIAFVGPNGIAKTTLFQILDGRTGSGCGYLHLGRSRRLKLISRKTTPAYFDGVDMNLVDWLRQYSKDQDESFLRGFLGRMLFSGEEALEEGERSVRGRESSLHALQNDADRRQRADPG